MIDGIIELSSAYVVMMLVAAILVYSTVHNIRMILTPNYDIDAPPRLIDSLRSVIVMLSIMALCRMAGDYSDEHLKTAL